MNNGIRILIVLAVSGGILFGAEKLVTHFMKENMNSKSSFVVSGNHNYDALFLGHCMPAFTVSPSAFDSVTGTHSFNLAQHNASYAENLITLHLYLENNEAPKYLFLCATPESFDRGFNNFHAFRYAHFMDDPLIASIIEKEDPEFYRWSMIPYVKFGYYNDQVNFNAVQGWSHERQERKLPFFKDGLELPVDEKGVRAFEKPTYENDYQFKWDSGLESYYNRIIDLAKSQNIQVVLFETPMNTDLADEASLPNREEMLYKIHRLASKRNLRFWTFEELDMTKEISNYYSTLNLKYPSVIQFSKEMGSRFNEEYAVDETEER